ncbi:MAG: aminopeptidase P N-terminal domain-containing protein [Myxococcales bacterium]|nr:aminopeptidase P N-terminal domain-containing protein [Myxococcales bacterium]
MGPDAAAIVIGHHVVSRSSDTEYPFRQNSDFHYLTGFDHPSAVALFRTDDGPPFTLFVQPRDKSAETWHGYRPGLEGAKNDFEADEAFSIDTLLEEIPNQIERVVSIYHTLGRSADLDRTIVATLDGLRQRSKLGFEPAEKILDPRDILHGMRLIKELGEIEIMRRAAEITCTAHQEAARLCRDGNFEYQLEAALGHVFRRLGGSGPAYGTIVGGGKNATILHYVVNDQKLRGGDLCLVDAGVELEGYASDVTRTYPVGGRFQGPGRAVYEVVLAAQQAALAACRPGTTLPEIHQTTVRTLIEGMVSLGLLSGTVDDLVKSETYRDYFMHGTSHWLGLDVHDVGSYTAKGKALTLVPGMVFTVEPGLYISEDDTKAPEHLRGIGIRIEDDILITEDGIENFNHAIPKKPDEIEAWMS